MTVRVDVEEIEATKGEKVLAVVMAAFLLLGGIWAYSRIDDWARDAIGGPPVYQPAPRDPAILRAQEARAALHAAESRESAALQEMTLAREDYRTALDAGRRAPGLRRRYVEAKRLYAAATAERARAEARVREAAPAERAALDRANASYEADRRRVGRWTFALRALLSAFLLVATLVAQHRLRLRRSRYYVLALGAVGAAAVLVFVAASDYVTDYVDPLDLGPIVLSLFGVACTVVAFAALQRYLARRLPLRRVRRRECPFCGHPAREGTHCEGCGREVVAPCAACSAPRRLGAPHCGACGAA